MTAPTPEPAETPDGTVTAAQAYQEVVQRVTDLVSPLIADRPDGDDLPVPATPGWTVHDVVAHLAGVSADVLSGQMAGAPGPEWTARHVAAGRDVRMPALLTAWRDRAEAMGRVIAANPRPGGQTVFDAVTHEYDLREAIGLPLPERDPVADIAIAWAEPYFRRVTEKAGHPPVPLERAGVVERLRIIAGRRDRAAVQRALGLDDAGTESVWPALTWGVFDPSRAPSG